ncbi:hypothetical protein V8G54_017506 [Vigna mungo]|uniref:Uncharacterized protein n=1 Tax=Vigna mungo TaxID=3915 RepID=A0AAQ3S241_VIGMU
MLQPFQNPLSSHFPHRSNLTPLITLVLSLFPKLLRFNTASELPPIRHKLNLLIKIQRVKPHEPRVIPRTRMRLISEIRHVENPGPSARGMHDLLLKRGMAIRQESMNKHKSLNSHNPITSLCKSLGNGDKSSTDVASGMRCQSEDFFDVFVISRNLFMACGFDDQDFEVRGQITCHFGYADAGLVLHHTNRLADCARCHNGCLIRFAEAKFRSNFRFLFLWDWS